VLHFSNPQLRGEFERAVRLEEISRRAAVLIGNARVPYPFQYNLWALGSGAVVRSAIKDLRRAAARPRASSGSFADALQSTWGPTLVSEFFRPYNEKLWGRALEDLPADCLGRYVPRVDVGLAERGASRPVGYAGYNDSFLYPASGRFGDIMAALASPVRHAIRHRCRVTAVDLSRHEVSTADGETVGYGRLISTIPLAHLVELAGLNAHAHDLFAATEVVNVRVGVRGVSRTTLHWIYVPDPELPFHRIGFPGNVNSATCPAGCASLSIEYTIPAFSPRLSGQAIASTALEYVSRQRLVDIEEHLMVDECLISPAYVVHRAPGRREFGELARNLSSNGVQLAGRFGAWDYMSVEDAYASGIRAARVERRALTDGVARLASGPSG